MCVSHLTHFYYEKSSEHFDIESRENPSVPYMKESGVILQASDQ